MYRRKIDLGFERFFNLFGMLTDILLSSSMSCCIFLFCVFLKCIFSHVQLQSSACALRNSLSSLDTVGKTFLYQSLWNNETRVLIKK